MLDHVSLGVTNLERSRHFYDEALRPLGIVRTVDFDRGSDYGAMTGSLGVEFTITVEPSVTVSRGTHLCFRAPNRDAVCAFHASKLLRIARGGIRTRPKSVTRQTAASSEMPGQPPMTQGRTAVGRRDATMMSAASTSRAPYSTTRAPRAFSLKSS